MNLPPIRRALISVSNKDGLAAFAAALAEYGIEIFSTGGTRRYLQDSDLTVHDISAYTGFPEMMDGRLKTLHPKVFGGILARHDHEGDRRALQEHQIHAFELVVVNLYPFAETIGREGITEASAIEQIDIGGPSLVRAAAKNYRFVTIVTDPAQYGEVLQEIRGGGCTESTRRRLAAAAFAHTAQYDRVVADYFAGAGKDSAELFPIVLAGHWHRRAELRYGENPHQEAALYADPAAGPGQLVAARQLNGKELSYNNYLDLDAALSIVRRLPRPAVSVIKHHNPCGAASADQLPEAAAKALSGDPVAAYGSILGCNRPIDAATAAALTEPGLFIEAIIAPGFDEQALELLTTRPKWKKNVRLMSVGELAPPQPTRQLRQIDGGVLVQIADNLPSLSESWQVVTSAEPSIGERAELAFAWELVRHVSSNAIVITRGEALCGAGAGQMSRVDAVEIAIRKAGDRAPGAVMASDAFFPFPDSIHVAAAAGIKAVIQPGGSRKDEEVIAACNEHGMSMIMTGRRHFRH